MARIRTIKPEYWTNGQVMECSTNARLLFIGLWNFADDAGRHPWRAKQIKAQIFPSDPFTEKDIQGMLLELSKNNLITKYVIDEQEYFTIDGWHHQRIDKPQPPKYPEPPKDHSKNITGTLPPDSKGKDRKGKDNKAQPFPIPNDFSLTDDLIDHAKGKGVSNLKVLNDFTENFIEQNKAKGYKYADHKAAWRTWFGKALKSGEVVKDPVTSSENY